MKTDRRATNIGHCQACDSEQKLPLGVLSQHGYTVEWSQFQGVCDGHGHLPYELSCELIPSLISEATIRKDRMTEAQTELRAPTTANRLNYVFDRGRLNFPEAARIEVNQRGYFSAVAESDGHEVAISTYSVPHDTTDAIELVNVLRGRDADALQFQIDQESRYIKWQEARLADWKIRPLQNVLEIEAAEAAKTREALDGKKKVREAKRTAKIIRDGERAARLIAKYERLVPADIRENLVTYTHPTLHAELYGRRGIRLPPTVDGLLFDLLETALGKRAFTYRSNPWRQVEAAQAVHEESKR